MKICKLNDNHPKDTIQYIQQTRICDSWEIRCDNGRCIQDEMNYNGYNPCGDHSDCKLPVGSIVGIVIGSLAGLAIVMTVIVVSICCYRRHKDNECISFSSKKEFLTYRSMVTNNFRHLPTQCPVPNVATDYIISTSSSQLGAIISSYNPWYSTGHHQKLLDNMTFSKRPWNVCAQSDFEVALTVPSLKTIRILGFNQKMHKIRDIRTKLECWGIAAILDQLVITTGKDDHCIFIIDKAGTDLMSSRSICYQNKQLLRPMRVGNDVMKAVMYMSYKQGEKLVANNYAWNVVFTYRNPDMKALAGVDDDKEGNVYTIVVMDRTASNIYQPMEGLPRLLHQRN
ncbi:hypothetical protein CHS0354_022106 [Potamilus streckersoni]|uniref:Uncharacterized protein n=1 Tax=Potamilus streckersoni TaxID=2493646 RepID=A0AAE0VK42_9BIVA|nr:hypothetical protein CHS0354_022106 [Potamilus streckersoni]